MGAGAYSHDHGLLWRTSFAYIWDNRVTHVYYDIRSYCYSPSFDSNNNHNY